MGSVVVEPRLSWVLRLLFGDCETNISWSSPPENFAGRAVLVQGEPYGAAYTFERILEASVMDLSTMAIIVIPRRLFQSWHKAARPFTTIATFPAGSVFNPPTNFESVIVLILLPYRCNAPVHDRKIKSRLQESVNATDTMRGCRRYCQKTDSVFMCELALRSSKRSPRCLGVLHARCLSPR